jgi:hypothetical protein
MGLLHYFDRANSNDRVVQTIRSISPISPTCFFSRLTDTGPSVPTSWAKTDTLYSSMVQKKASTAARFSAEVDGIHGCEHAG